MNTFHMLNYCLWKHLHNIYLFLQKYCFLRIIKIVNRQYEEKYSHRKHYYFVWFSFLTAWLYLCICFPIIIILSMVIKMKKKKKRIVV